MKQLNIRIREAEPWEASLLSKIAHEAKSFWNYPEELLRLWKNDLTVTPDFIAANVVRCAVAESAIIGFYALSTADTCFELDHLWVSPAYIGKGIGSKLFEDAIIRITNKGGGVLKILSDPNAEEFYLKKGARRVAELPSKPAGRMLPLLQLSVNSRHHSKLKTIRVYKTNVDDESKAKSILEEIRRKLPGSDPSFDLEDCDKVLRVENRFSDVDESKIKKILGNYGCQLQLLPL